MAANIPDIHNSLDKHSATNKKIIHVLCIQESLNLV